MQRMCSVLHAYAKQTNARVLGFEIDALQGAVLGNSARGRQARLSDVSVASMSQ